MAQNQQTDQGPDAASEQQQQKRLQSQDQLCDELRRVAQEHFASMDRAIQSSLRRCLFSHIPSSHQALQRLPGGLDDDIAVKPGADPRHKGCQARNNSVHAWAGSQQAGLPELLDGLSPGPPDPEAPDSFVTHSAPPMMPSTETADMKHDLEEVPSYSVQALLQMLPGGIDDSLAATPSADPWDEGSQARNQVHAWAGSQQAGLPELLDGLRNGPPDPEAPDSFVAHDGPPMPPSEPAVMKDDAEEVDYQQDQEEDQSSEEFPQNDSKRASFTQLLPENHPTKKRGSLTSQTSRDPRFVTKNNPNGRKSVAFFEKNGSGRGTSDADDDDESNNKRTMFASLSKMMGSNVGSPGKSAANMRSGLRRASLFTSDTKRLMLKAQQTWPQRIVSNKFWNVFSFGLIILNSVLIGWQTQAMAVRTLDDVRNGRVLRVEEPIGFTVAQILFTFAFTFELTMRWLAEGLREFWMVDTSWNMLDLVVVILGWTDVLMLVVTAGGAQPSSTFMTLRVMRVLRIIRLGRIVRMLKFFRELRMMITSILASFKSLGWVCIILIVMFYIFGISFTSGVTDNLVSRDAGQDAENDEMVLFFGTLGRSILTLYMSMTGGEDWRLFHNSLKELPFFYGYLFIVFITFAILAVFNIVTGVFVESAMASSQQDREAVVQDEIEAKRTYFKAMETLFEEMDEDDSGTITLDEFESRLDDERVSAYFNSLKLDVSDAKMLFQLLDHDGSEEISYSEFVSGCQRLQGEATSLDAKVMQYEVKYLKNQMDYVIGFLDRLPANSVAASVLAGGAAATQVQTVQDRPGTPPPVSGVQGGSLRLARTKTQEFAQALAIARGPASG